MKKLALLLIAAACGAADDDLGAALPRAATLQIGLPAVGSGAAKPGRPAELWLLTRRTGAELNGLIGQVIGQMERLLEQPPTHAGDGATVWGPFTPALSPVSYRLVATGAAGAVAYHLDGRPKGGGDWQVLVTGTAAADGHAGEIHVDLAGQRALDPAVGGTAGALAVGYDVGAAATRLALRLDGAQYEHAQLASGAGDLAFAGPGGAIRSRWLATGAGRAEVSAGVVECWDDSFALVFVAGPGGADGDPAACPDVR
jgi:hypothetical protein